MTSEYNGPVALGVAIRQRRKALRLDQVQAGKRMGVSQQTVGKWEDGKARPSPERFAAIASFLEQPEGAVAAILYGAGHAPDYQEAIERLETMEARIVRLEGDVARLLKGPRRPVPPKRRAGR